jgi:hypothetical protein
MPKATLSSNGSGVAGTVDFPAKAPARTKKKKDKPPATDPLTWPESKIGTGERVKSFPPSSYENTKDS